MKSIMMNNHKHPEEFRITIFILWKNETCIWKVLYLSTKLEYENWCSEGLSSFNRCVNINKSEP